jgi:DNA-binding ferritin-like protein
MAQPAQDLAGVQTWVTKTRQDQINNDTSKPDKSREDYQDGVSQRDRVLPLPSGHPEGRDEQRVGPGVFNAPPDSSGQGGASRKPKDPSALNDHPSGKALHERPRSSAVPGDEYGNPYIDQSTSTGLKRRVSKFMKEVVLEMEPISYWDVEEDQLVRVANVRVRPPVKHQREQKGQQKRKYQVWKRKNRVKYRAMLRKKKRDYASNKGGIKTRSRRRQVLVRRNPSRFKRYEGGGISTSKQKSKRDNKTRKKAMRRASIGYSLPFNLTFKFMGIEGYLMSLSEMTYSVNVLLEGETSINIDIEEFLEEVEWDKPKYGQMFEEMIEDSFATPTKGVYNDWTDFDQSLQQEPPAKGEVVKKASSNSVALLQVLLACLRGAHWAHWNSHWQVKGQSFYSDHLMLQRIYESLEGEIDSLAEKIVSYYGPEAVDPVQQAQLMANKLLPLADIASSKDPLKRALLIEEALQVVFKTMYDLLKKNGQMTLGLDDFLMSMANAHESNLYLLRQKTRL